MAGGHLSGTPAGSAAPATRVWSPKANGSSDHASAMTRDFYMVDETGGAAGVMSRKNTCSSSLFLRQPNLTYSLSAFLQVKLPTWPERAPARAGDAECERRGGEFRWEYWFWSPWP